MSGFLNFAFKRVFNGIVPEKKTERKKSDFLCNRIRKKEVENMGKFEKDGISNLRRAYIEGSKRSRFDDKKEGVDGRFIYADVSHKNHLSNWKQFAKWAEEKGLKRIGQIQKKHVENYVKELVDSGMSKKTIESRIGAINKIMLYSERWNNESRIVLSKIEGVKARELPTKNL